MQNKNPSRRRYLNTEKRFRHYRLLIGRSILRNAIDFTMIFLWTNRRTAVAALAVPRAIRMDRTGKEFFQKSEKWTVTKRLEEVS